MRHIHQNGSQPSRVTAVFEDRALSFLLRKGGTLEDVVAHLDLLGEQRSAPLAIVVKFRSLPKDELR